MHNTEKTQGGGEKGCPRYGLEEGLDLEERRKVSDLGKG